MSIKFAVQSKDLHEVVSAASKSTARKSTVPALEGIHIEVKGDTLTATGYDLSKGISSTTLISSNADNTSSFVIDRDVLPNILAKLPECVVEVEVKDNILSIKADKLKLNSAVISGEEFPTVPSLTDKKAQLTVNYEDLKFSLQRVLFAVSPNSIKPILTGVRFVENDGELILSAISNYSCATCTMKVENNSNEEKLDFVVQATILQDLIKVLAKGGKNVDIKLDDNMVCFSSDKVNVFGRLLEGDFPDVSKMIRGESKIELLIPVADFSDSLNRGLLLHSSTGTPIKLGLSQTELLIETISPTGKLSESLPVESINFDGKEFDIGFNPRYLFDAVANSRVAEISLGFDGALKSVVISADGYKSMIMPVRLKG